MTKPAYLRPIAGKQQRAMRVLADEPLAKLVGRGSDHAFATLCERHSQTLHRYCLSILRNEHDAQDALQATMTQAYAALRARERDVSLRAWLFGIAHNESVTILRKRARQVDSSQRGDACASDPHAVFEERVRLDQLVADLHALPERQRATLVMRELNGLDMQEIARALDITATAVKQSLFEARNSLRDFDRGREMACEEIRSAISTHDRRILRGRRIRAHLDTCESCRGYRNAIGVREADLRTLVPALPAPALAAALARAFGAGRWNPRTATAAGTPSGSGQELLAHASASALLKIGASIAVLATGAAGAIHIAGTRGRAHARDRSAAIASERFSQTAIGDRRPEQPATSAPTSDTVASRPTPRPPSPTVRRGTTGISRHPTNLAAPSSQATPRVFPVETQTTPSDGQTPMARLATSISDPRATPQKDGSAKPAKGRGNEGTNPSREHGPSADEQDLGSESEQEQSSAEHGSTASRSTASHDKGDNENGQSGREQAPSRSAGNGHSEHSAE